MRRNDDNFGCFWFALAIIVLGLCFAIDCAIVNSDIPDIWKVWLLK